MRLRLALTIACGLTLGVFAYTGEKYEYAGGVWETLHASDLFLFAVMALAVVTGIVVRRIWVLLALLGPLLALAYLQASGYVSEWHDGSPPLGLPNIVQLIWFGLLLLLGLGVGSLGSLWTRRADPSLE